MKTMTGFLRNKKSPANIMNLLPPLQNESIAPNAGITS
jgi:hypothetical protein